MKEVKLLYFKDILSYLRRFTALFVVALLLLWASFFAYARLPRNPKFIATTQLALNYAVNHKLDYDTSVKLASNFNFFNIKPLIQDVLEHNSTLTPPQSVTVKAESYQNLINCTVVSNNPEHSIAFANALAHALVEWQEKQNDDHITLKVISSSEHASQPSYTLNTTRKITLSMILVFVLSTLLIFKELARTTVKTKEEALGLTHLPVCFDMNRQNKMAQKEQEAFLHYLNKINLPQVNIMPVGMKDYNAELLHNLAKEEHHKLNFIDCVLNYPKVLEETAPVFILIAKNRCDFRDLQTAQRRCIACGINILGVIIG